MQFVNMQTNICMICTTFVMLTVFMNGQIFHCNALWDGIFSPSLVPVYDMLYLLSTIQTQ